MLFVSTLRYASASAAFPVPVDGALCIFRGRIVPGHGMRGTELASAFLMKSLSRRVPAFSVPLRPTVGPTGTPPAEEILLYLPALRGHLLPLNVDLAGPG